jgi:hypothetical protein
LFPAPLTVCDSYLVVAVSFLQAIFVILKMWGCAINSYLVVSFFLCGSIRRDRLVQVGSVYAIHFRDISSVNGRHSVEFFLTTGNMISHCRIPSFIWKSLFLLHVASCKYAFT